MSQPATDLDSPWKEVIERYFQAFMAFFFPEAHAGIAWERGYEFLDKELQRVVRDAKLGRRLADKLVKVWRSDGVETWVLIHVEVQGQAEPDFPKRMYVYNYRLFDRYDRQVVSLAVLGDAQADWRPAEYGYTLWGCQVGLRFPMVKLLDYEERWDELAMSANPFAIIVMAHLKALATRHDVTARFNWKVYLVRRLYMGGFSREDVLELFRILDWALSLPDELTRSFEETIIQFEEESMPYITSIERLGQKRGELREARLSVVEVLQARFATVAPSIVEALNRIEDIGVLRALLNRAVMVQRLDEFAQAL
jgi:hypothetical protein